MKKAATLQKATFDGFQIWIYDEYSIEYMYILKKYYYKFISRVSMWRKEKTIKVLRIICQSSDKWGKGQKFVLIQIRSHCMWTGHDVQDMIILESSDSFFLLNE